MKVIYVAGPFRAKSYWEQEQNIRRAEELALKVWTIGGVGVICPHTNTRFYQGALPDEVWLNGDIEIMLRCDAVLMVEGWKTSAGSVAEMWEAQVKGIPVFESIDELQRWLRANRPYSEPFQRVIDKCTEMEWTFIEGGAIRLAEDRRTCPLSYAAGMRGVCGTEGAKALGFRNIVENLWTIANAADNTMDLTPLEERVRRALIKELKVQ